MKRTKLIAIFTFVIFLCSLTAGSVLADSSSASVVMSTAYPAIVTDKGKSVTFNIDVMNSTQDWQELDLRVAEGPADWNPTFKSSGYTLKKIMVAPSKTQSLEFQVKSPEDAKSQDYSFVVQALKSNQVVAQLRLTVSLIDKPSKGMKLSTQYPQLRGQAGSSFSFKVDLSNDIDQDRSINFSATAPEGWEVTFKPAYESKQVSTVRVKGNNTQGMDVDVSVPQKTEAGDYSIIIQASAEGDRAELPLRVTIVGSSKLSLSTPSGQVSTRASVDSPGKLTLSVKNSGTAPLKNIALSASRPEGWDVTFNPEKIEQLAVDQTVQVNATIKPSNKALAGDYMVTITASGLQASDSKDIRVTVETPTTWGWVAVGAIVAVLGGLGFIFWRFSRR